jgi:hypothetical protein
MLSWRNTLSHPETLIARRQQPANRTDLPHAELPMLRAFTFLRLTPEMLRQPYRQSWARFMARMARNSVREPLQGGGRTAAGLAPLAPLARKCVHPFASLGFKRVLTLQQRAQAAARCASRCPGCQGFGYHLVAGNWRGCASKPWMAIGGPGIDGHLDGAARRTRGAATLPGGGLRSRSSLFVPNEKGEMVPAQSYMADLQGSQNPPPWT